MRSFGKFVVDEKTSPLLAVFVTQHTVCALITARANLAKARGRNLKTKFCLWDLNSPTSQSSTLNCNLTAHTAIVLCKYLVLCSQVSLHSSSSI